MTFQIGKSPPEECVISTEASVTSETEKSPRLCFRYTHNLSASTLRKASSKSLRLRTRVEGAGKGEFAFTECRNITTASRKTVAFARKRSRRCYRDGRQIHLPSSDRRLAATRGGGRARALGRRGRNIYNLFSIVILSDSEGSEKVDILPFGNSICSVRGSIWPRECAASICGAYAPR